MHEPMRLSASAAALWDLLCEPMTFDALVAELAERFGTESKTIETDTAPVVARLLQAGALATTS